MPTPQLIRYPLDPTGSSPDNRVEGELHTMVRRNTRAIATTYGAFYTDSMVIRDTSNNQILTKGVQYYPAELYEVPTARYGKEVCAIIVIVDESVSDNVSLSYQCVGGEFSTSQTAIIQQIEALNLDDRPIGWGSIIDKPTEYNPSHHLHDVGDVYGFEYVVHALDRIREAIMLGDTASHDEIYAYIDLVTSQLQAATSQVQANLTAHSQRTDNPHQVTMAQLNGYTKPEIDAMFNGLNDGTASALQAHLANFSNPHQVNKTQLGLGNVSNFPMASYAEALAGTQGDRYMSPVVTKYVVDIHSQSGAHDGRYVLRDAGIEGSIHAPGNGYAYVWISGGWRPFWPPQWQ